MVKKSSVSKMFFAKKVKHVTEKHHEDQMLKMAREFAISNRREVHGGEQISIPEECKFGSTGEKLTDLEARQRFVLMVRREVHFLKKAETKDAGVELTRRVG